MMHDSSKTRKASRPDKFAPSHARLAFAALMLGNICLACGPLMVRLADVGPVASGFWRLALAAPLLLLIGRATGNSIARLPLRTWLLIGVGGLFFAADLAAWHSGIVQTKLANATLFGNVTSFTFALYGFIVARALPGRNQGVALLLAALGVARATMKP